MEPFCLQVLEELYKNSKKTFGKIEEEELSKIVSILIGAKKIYVLGIGHSGMFGKIFAMKLNHVGLKAYTIFDEINPPFEKGDIFVAISQSGETATIITLAHKAKRIGGGVIGITSKEKSTLAGLSDSILKVEKVAKHMKFSVLSTIGDEKNQNLLGLIFGFNIYVLFYTLIFMIARDKGENPESINQRHANLQ